MSKLRRLVLACLTLLSCCLISLWALSYMPLDSNLTSDGFITHLSEGDIGWFYVGGFAQGSLSAVCCRGHLTVEHLLELDDEVKPANIPQLQAYVLPRAAPTSLMVRQRTRFSVFDDAPEGRMLERRIDSPLWIPLVLFAAYPLCALMPWLLRHPRVQPHVMPVSLRAWLDRVRSGRHWRRWTAGISFASIALLLAMVVLAGSTFTHVSFERWRDYTLTADWNANGLQFSRIGWSNAVQRDERTERRIGPLTYRTRMRNFDAILPSFNTLQYTRSLDFPRWLVLSTIGLYPLLLFVRERFRRRRRSRKGKCIECGYDLHGIHSAACPECGEPV